MVSSLVFCVYSANMVWRFDWLKSKWISIFIYFYCCAFCETNSPNGTSDEKKMKKICSPEVNDSNLLLLSSEKYEQSINLLVFICCQWVFSMHSSPFNIGESHLRAQPNFIHIENINTLRNTNELLGKSLVVRTKATRILFNYHFSIKKVLCFVGQSFSFFCFSLSLSFSPILFKVITSSPTFFFSWCRTYRESCLDQWIEKVVSYSHQRVDTTTTHTIYLKHLERDHIIFTLKTFSVETFMLASNEIRLKRPLQLSARLVPMAYLRTS